MKSEKIEMWMREIALQLSIANKLKALELKYPKILQSSKEIDKIIEANK